MPVAAAAAAAAAKSLQSGLTLCDPIDGSPPSSPVPGILQARTLEWVHLCACRSPLSGSSKLPKEQELYVNLSFFLITLPKYKLVQIDIEQHRALTNQVRANHSL